MKRFTAVLSFLITFATGAQAFEGNITWQVTETSGKSSTVICQVKGDRALVTSDRLRGQGTLLVIPKEKTLYTMVPALRLAMKQPLPDVASSARSLGAVTLTATTRKETIAGLPCTVYTFRTDDAVGETCAANGLEPLLLALGANGQWPAWAQDVMKKGLFPLRASGKDKSGHPFRLVATEVRRTQLPASLMAVPNDFHVTEGVDLGGLLGGNAQP